MSARSHLVVHAWLGSHFERLAWRGISTEWNRNSSIVQIRKDLRSRNLSSFDPPLFEIYLLAIKPHGQSKANFWFPLFFKSPRQPSSDTEAKSFRLVQSSGTAEDLAIDTSSLNPTINICPSTTSVVSARRLETARCIGQLRSGERSPAMSNGSE